MQGFTQTNSRGFTLVELMVVVAVVGLLASVAVPTYMQSVRDAKTAEAEGNLKTLKDGAVIYFNEVHQDANGNSVTKRYLSNNSFECTRSGYVLGGKDAPEPDDFAPDTTFSKLKFTLTEPHYYRYCYLGNESSFFLYAFAALNGYFDSVYRQLGYVVDGRPDIRSVEKIR